MSMKSSERKGVIEDLVHSTLYALKFEAIFHDNSSLTLKEQQHLKTKVCKLVLLSVSKKKPLCQNCLKLIDFQFGGTVYMEVSETTFKRFKLHLRIEGSDKLETNHNIKVQCSHKQKEKWITEEVDVEANDILAMHKVIPNTKYNCSGSIIDDNETILVKEISVFTCSQKDIKIQTKIEDIQTHHFR